ncbi:helix-turn-helix domain-containing protein [Actinocorallia libanotica]|uniref:Helix-turn-helix domain-containing protein n=1 Tax=Actinocorallia libanotica TaxID=46162 RepID=A0ABN1RVN4_9ACTN
MAIYSIADLKELPPTLDVPTAAKLLGLSRTKAYQLAKSGDFPCRVLKIGHSYRVPTLSLLRLLDAGTLPKNTAQSDSARARLRSQTDMAARGLSCECCLSRLRWAVQTNQLGQRRRLEDR